MKNVNLTNPLKLIVLLTLIVGSFVYVIVAMFVDGGDTTIAWSIISGASFYLVGNGTGARGGVPTVAPFTPTIEKAIQHLEEVKEKSVVK